MELSELIALLPAWVSEGLAMLTMAIGGATLTVAGLEKFAKITPSTKDDMWASKAKRFLGKATAILDKVAMSKRGK